MLDERVDTIADTKRGTEGTEVLKRELNSFFRRRRSSETSGKSPAEKGHETRRLLLLSLLPLLVGFLSRDSTANLAWNIHLARSHPRAWRLGLAVGLSADSPENRP